MCQYKCKVGVQMPDMLGITSIPVVLTFSLICTAIFFIDRPTGGAMTNEWFTLHANFSLARPGDWLTIFSYVIGHANIQHLLGNLTFILLLGPILEEKYGSRNLLIMMGLTALITGVLNLALFDTGVLGASGIVFMFIILVCFLTRALKTQLRQTKQIH